MPACPGYSFVGYTEKYVLWTVKKQEVTFMLVPWVGIDGSVALGFGLVHEGGKG